MTSRAHLTCCAILLALFAGASAMQSEPYSLDYALDYEKGAPSGTSYSDFYTLLNSSSVNATIETFITSNSSNGVIFAPDNAAFNSFVSALWLPIQSPLQLHWDFLNAVIGDHVILAGNVSGMNETKNFTSFSGNMLTVTFNYNGSITMVKPAYPAPMSFAQMAYALGHYGPVPDGNATLVYVNNVLLTNETYEMYIGKGAASFYDAIALLVAEGESFTWFKAVLGFSGQSHFKDYLDMTTYQANGTLFAPIDSAFEWLASMLGGGATLDSLESTVGLINLTSTILEYHYTTTLLPASSFPSSETQPVETWADYMKLSVSLAPSYVIEYPSGNYSMNATVVTADLKTITDNGYAPGTPQGYVHSINSVLLPYNKPINLADFMYSAPENMTYMIYKKAVEEIQDMNITINGPALRGVAFAPSDAAFTSFLNSTGLSETLLFQNLELLQDILLQHTIQDQIVDGENTTYVTWGGLNITVTVDGNMMPMKYSRTSGDIYGMPNTAMVEGWSKEQNMNGYNAEMLYNMTTTGINGRVYFTDNVIVSNSTLNKILNSPTSSAGGAWESALGGSSQFSSLAQVLPSKIEGLLNGSEVFTAFMPDDQAFSSLANDLQVSTSDLLSHLNKDSSFVMEMLYSYFVMESEYNTVLQDNMNYTTMNSNVMLEKSDGTITLYDKTSSSSGRKLLQMYSSASISGSGISFLDGKQMYTISSTPLTSSQQATVKSITSGAASCAPSIMLLLAVIAAFVSL